MYANFDHITCMLASIASHVSIASITSHASIASHVCSHQSHHMYRSHRMHWSHHMHAHIDHINVSIASHGFSHGSHHMYALIDRITSMLASTSSIKVGTKSTFPVKLRKDAVWPPSGDQKLIVLNVLLPMYWTYSDTRTGTNHAVLHPVWTQEVKKVPPYLPTHSCTSDTTLRAPTSTHMLHLFTSNSSSSVTATTDLIHL